MASAIWKIPRNWRPSLADRTALYPALHLRWAGHRVAISSDPGFGAWSAADLRVLIADGPLTAEDRELMTRTAARGLDVVLASQSGLSEPDRAFAFKTGATILAWRDPGPLASPPPRRPGERIREAAASAARLAEDRLVLAELGLEAPPVAEPQGPRIVVAAENAKSLDAVWPALAGRLARGGARIVVTCDSPDDLARMAERQEVTAVAAHDPALMGLIHGAEAFLCAYPKAPPDGPRPAQWARATAFSRSAGKRR